MKSTTLSYFFAALIMGFHMASCEKASPPSTTGGNNVTQSAQEAAAPAPACLQTPGNEHPQEQALPNKAPVFSQAVRDLIATATDEAAPADSRFAAITQLATLHTNESYAALVEIVGAVPDSKTRMKLYAYPMSEKYPAYRALRKSGPECVPQVLDGILLRIAHDGSGDEIRLLCSLALAFKPLGDLEQDLLANRNGATDDRAVTAQAIERLKEFVTTKPSTRR